MNAQAILDKIQSDAREAASTILNEANNRAAAYQKASEEKIVRMRADAEKRAAADGAQLEQRMIRMAELDQKKLLLAAKRELIDRAFQLALSKLTAMPKEQAQRFLLSVVVQAAQGRETMIAGSEHDAWLTPDFPDRANAALVQAGKPGQLTLSKEKRAGVCGLILSYQDMEINCTFEALVEAERLELEAEVARVLFQ